MKKHENIQQVGPNKWRLDFTVSGRRKRVTVNGTLAMAKRALVIERKKLYDQRYSPRKVKRIRFKEYATIYRDQYVSKNRPTTQDAQQYIIERLVNHFGQMFLDEIRPGTVDRYKYKREQDGVCNATINRDLAVMRAIFYKAIGSEEYGLDRNPVAKAGLLDEDSRREREPMTQDEITRLIEAAEALRADTLPLFLSIALNTGMRKMEILSLEWRHIDFAANTITVTRERSKSRKARVIPMNASLSDFLRAAKMASAEPWVFPSPKTDSHVRNVKDVFRKACIKAQIDNLRVHDLRHTAASYLVNDCGFSLKEAAEILGHSKIDMTARYVHSNGERKQRGMEKLGEIVNTTRHNHDTPAGPAIIDRPASVSQSYS